MLPSRNWTRRLTLHRASRISASVPAEDDKSDRKTTRVLLCPPQPMDHGFSTDESQQNIPRSFWRMVRLSLAHIWGDYYFTLYVWVFCAHVCPCSMHVQHSQTAKGYQIHSDWSYRLLWASAWILGEEPGSLPSPEIFVLRLFMLVIRIGKKHQFLNLCFISVGMNLWSLMMTQKLCWPRLPELDV